MKNTYLLALLLIAISCHKDDQLKSDNTDDIKQFHKVVLSDNGENKGSLTSAFSFTNNAGYPNVLYYNNEADGSINNILYWVAFTDQAKPVFKKKLFIPGNSYPMWMSGFAKEADGDLVFAGTWWNRSSFGNGFIVKSDDQGNIKSQKVILFNPNEPTTLRLDAVYPAGNDGYICISLGYRILKLDVNANVQWQLDFSDVKTVGTYNFPTINGATQDKEGNIIVGMTENLSGTAYDYLMKVDTHGNVLWCKQYSFTLSGSGNLTIDNLFVGDDDHIYAFEDYSTVPGYFSDGYIRGFETDADGVSVNSFELQGDCANLYDVHYQDNNFYILCGTTGFTRCQYVQLTNKFLLTKQGVILSATGLSTLPGKAFTALNGQYTDFVISAPSLDDKAAWQYIRLDNHWKYPFYDYSVPSIQVVTGNLPYKSLAVNAAQVHKWGPEMFVTSDQPFSFQDYSIDKMTVADYSE